MRVFLYSRFLYAFIYPLIAWDVFEQISQQIGNIEKNGHGALDLRACPYFDIGLLIASSGDDPPSNGAVVGTIAIILWAGASTASLAFLFTRATDLEGSDGGASQQYLRMDAILRTRIAGGSRQLFLIHPVFLCEEHGRDQRPQHRLYLLRNYDHRLVSPAPANDPVRRSFCSPAGLMATTGYVRPRTMDFLDNLENSLKNLEQQEERDSNAVARQMDERRRAAEIAPWADALKKSSYVQNLFEKAAIAGHRLRSKIYIAWLENTLRLESKGRWCEIQPNPEWDSIRVRSIRRQHRD